MARLSRFYIKDQPQHIIHRGNNRIDIFRSDDDYGVNGVRLDIIRFPPHY